MTQLSKRAVRGVRDSIPSGLVGRAEGGKGPAGIVTWRQIAVAVAHYFKGGAATASNGSLLPGDPDINSLIGGGSGANGFGFSDSGLFLDGEYLGSAIWGYDMAFPSATLTDEAVCQFAPTADAVFSFLTGATIAGDTVTGGTVVGTLTFTAGSSVGAVQWMSGAGYTNPAGTPIAVQAPNPRDATLSGVTAAIYGDKQ